MPTGREVINTIKEAFDFYPELKTPWEDREVTLSYAAAVLLIDWVEQLERERDAAVERLARYRKCIDCVRYPEIKKNLFCDDCVQGSKWQWCGEPLEVKL